MHICNGRQFKFLCGDSKFDSFSIAITSDIDSFCVDSSCLDSLPFHTYSVVSRTQSEILNSCPLMDIFHVSRYCVFRKDEELANVYNKVATSVNTKNL